MLFVYLFQTVGAHAVSSRTFRMMISIPEPEESDMGSDEDGDVDELCLAEVSQVGPCESDPDIDEDNLLPSPARSLPPGIQDMLDNIDGFEFGNPTDNTYILNDSLLESREEFSNGNPILMVIPSPQKKEQVNAPNIAPTAIPNDYSYCTPIK